MERNVSIDYFKIVLCILVISIHLQPLLTSDSLIGWLISNGIGRIGVPCFFMINGYYLYSKIKSGKAILKYVKRLITIYATWTFVFLLLTVEYADLKLILSLFFGIHHLWYLSALIGGVIVLYFLKKYIKNDTVLLIITLGLFATGIYIQNNFFSISNASIRVLIFRNALFFCVPFLFLGYYIKEKQDKLKQIPNLALIVITTIGFITILYESSLLAGPKTIVELYYGMIIIAPALFILILKKSVFKVDDGYVGLLTSGIYYVHPLAIYILEANYKLSDMHIYMLPAVLILSALLTAGIIEINKRIKIFL